MHRFLISLILIVALLFGSLPTAYCLLPTVAYADIAEVASTFGNGQGGLSIVADVPAATSAQLVVAVIHLSRDTSLNPVLTAPAGWTSLGSFPSLYQYVEVFYRVGDGVTSATWTATNGITKYTYRIASYSNVNLTSPINVSGGSSTNVSAFHSTPTVTTTVANCLLIAIWGTGDSRITFSTDGSMTERLNIPGSAEGNALAISDVIKTFAGATGQKLATTNEISYGANFIVALAPAVATAKRKRPPVIID
jgi:hypothetical protein